MSIYTPFLFETVHNFQLPSENSFPRVLCTLKDCLGRISLLLLSRCFLANKPHRISNTHDFYFFISSLPPRTLLLPSISSAPGSCAQNRIVILCLAGSVSLGGGMLGGNSDYRKEKAASLVSSRGMGWLSSALHAISLVIAMTPKKEAQHWEEQVFLMLVKACQCSLAECGTILLMQLSRAFVFPWKCTLTNVRLACGHQTGKDFCYGTPSLT